MLVIHFQNARVLHENDTSLKSESVSHSVMCDSVDPWTTGLQAPLFMGFPRQEYCSGRHALLQGIFLTQGWKPRLLHWRQIL